MRRSKMLAMLKAGVDPIDVSIEKWKEILRLVKTGNYKRAAEQDRNCALCYVYRYDCTKCVLKSCDITDSPYNITIDVIFAKGYDNKGTKKEVIKVVQGMIQALEDLK